MNHPEGEIGDVIRQLCKAKSSIEQQETIIRYFVPNAGFQHPLCTVKRGDNSRGLIIGIYRWYRNMSPNLEIVVESSKFDEQLNIIYVNAVQVFHVWISPLKPVPARLLVRIDLNRSSEDGKYYIVQQTDYYQPEDILALTIPFLIYPLVFIKIATSWICVINSAIYLWIQALVLKFIPYSPVVWK
ncbi:hypothetical protein SCHPADRAFT_924757 [Schizopora paradoxa]|uniref:SigF-like NTF2-like domain-containing protein n=1 Tax=Schizopora paradoxa TaxID=27342 RepID=A0A0H2S4N1_9AGAM|nr:hypothetical protein SCHPADRAFT_924757 [Schizopora paradoxa]